eukprot:TRINITY_DN3186_c0_g1_i4.p1 TRINITY_DN3186_c0_g1~~TRINITY_DN3186_c0_g1_i4.p1  ORF type:complete len:290 (-),score=60.12 TRINITY_DN3186_c0_g1_i4:33-902(-)
MIASILRRTAALSSSHCVLHRRALSVPSRVASSRIVALSPSIASLSSLSSLSFLQTRLFHAQSFQPPSKVPKKKKAIPVDEDIVDEGSFAEDTEYDAATNNDDAARDVDEPSDLEELKKKLRAKKSTRTLPDSTLRNIGQTVKEKPWYTDLAGPPMLTRVLNCISQENGSNIRIFHVADRCDYCDYMVLTTGLSTSHLRAISDSVASMLRSRNESLMFRNLEVCPPHNIRIEGRDTDDWMAVDCGNVVVHILTQEGRQYYKLEELWPECEIKSVTARAGALEVWDDWDE